MSESINFRDGYLGVEIRHLAALDTVARTRSFSAAALELGYAQSAVSQQIAALERAVGQRLIERPGGPRPVTVTEAGTVLLQHARLIVARLGAARADLEALRTGERGVVRIGTFQSASARLLPPTLAAFRQSHPGVTVELQSESAVQPLADLILDGSIDLCFADISDVTSDFTVEHLLDDPYVVIAPLGHQLAGQPLVDPRQLDGADLIQASIDDPCAARIDQFCARTGIDRSVVFRSDDNITTQRLVASGLGLAIVPLLTVETRLPDCPVEIITLDPTIRITRRLGLMWHPDRIRTTAAQAFTDTAITVVRDGIARTLDTAA